MFKKSKILNLLYCGLFSLSFSIQTEASTVILPQCLLDQVKVEYTILHTSKNIVLIEINSLNIKELIATRDQQKTVCGGFIDVTEAWHNSHKINKAHDFLTGFTSSSIKNMSYSLRYPAAVNHLMAQLNPQYLWNRLINLSSYRDRYLNSNTGLAAATGIRKEVQMLAKNNNRNDVTLYTIPTGSFYKQPSIMAKIGNSDQPGIVIGAHMDTLQSITALKPGADDDGSGTVTVLEVARAILSSGMEFKKPIYLIWYAGEEMGLLGSQSVVNYFNTHNFTISEVLQFDMTGYAHKNDLTMWVMDDYVNPDLSNFVESLITTYVKRPVKHTMCGYACSDHAIWYAQGFSVAMSAESAFETSNPYMHSSNDTIENLSLTHMVDYAKLAFAFAVELAEPV